MRRVWAAAGTVWAVLGVSAVLAWTHPPSTPAPPPPAVALTGHGASAGTSAVSASAATAHATTHTS